VVYQYFCHNLPAVNEAPKLRRSELEKRVEACTGVNLEPAARSPEQAKSLRNILTVTGVDEKQLVAHLSWSTFTVYDLVNERLNGLNPFDNAHKVYNGSDDDTALNAGVERFTADPRALAALAYDADLSGLIALPTITLHALRDPQIPVAVEEDYARVVQSAGRSDLLVQTVTDERGHSKLAETQYLALLTALTHWIATGRRPDVKDIDVRCQALLATAPGGCDFIVR
jgi:hypothetical protein